MPFRNKMKKALGLPPGEGPEGSDLTQVSTKASTKKAKKEKPDVPDNVYKPGEIPPSKYRGPYNKAHQQKLHAFSFTTAFQGRRKSDQSLYSPMGSRMPSRMSSFISRKSFTKSRQQSRVEDTLMESQEADGGVENVGMSRQQTREDTRRPRTGDSSRSKGLEKIRTKDSDRTRGLEPPKIVDRKNTTGIEPTSPLASGNRQLHGGSFGQPFSADELVRAMTQSTLQPSAVQA